MKNTGSRPQGEFGTEAEIMIKNVIAAIGCIALASCVDTTAPSDSKATTTAQEVAEVTATDAQTNLPASLLAAVNGDWRSEDNRARDKWRHPAETLAFFEIEPEHTVIEIWPGRGWYTEILAPYLNSGGGQLIAVTWDIESVPEASRERYQTAIENFKNYFSEQPEIYGALQYSALSATSGPLGEPESVHAVLTFRNVHNWMAGNYEAKVFEDSFAVLKPGGIMGVVEHRLPSSDTQDPSAASGYVHEDYVKALAIAAGFEFVESSEINANNADTADHPFGVWTLPPASRTKDRDGVSPEGFDPQKYLDIGESDRMTLKFVKPAATE